MPFSFDKSDFRKSQKCPPGMHIATLVEVEEEYYNEKGTQVQRANFETDKGYDISTWFNDKMPSFMYEFVAAADDVTLTEDNAPTNIDLKEYVGKKVAISVSHGKDKNNKVQAQIDNFFSAAKVPF